MKVIDNSPAVKNTATKTVITIGALFITTLPCRTAANTVWNFAPGNSILNIMTASTSKIETVARDICTKRLDRQGIGHNDERAKRAKRAKKISPRG